MMTAQVLIQVQEAVCVQVDGYLNYVHPKNLVYSFKNVTVAYSAALGCCLFFDEDIEETETDFLFDQGKDEHKHEEEEDDDDLEDGELEGYSRLLVEAITHAFRPSSGVSCYQRLEFVGDAVLHHHITKHLFSMYTDLPT
ncbi:hypothetical protein L1887_41778 [Cichorium endivia]|nr:hypothetical protein L1887_41778 [Cichorium endivia]